MLLYKADLAKIGAISTTSTVQLQIFVVENFRNFRNYIIIMKIMFTKICVWMGP